MCEDSQKSSAAACKYLLDTLTKAPKMAKRRALEVTDILFAKSLRFREQVLGSVLLFVQKTVGKPIHKRQQDERIASVARTELESLALPIFHKWIERFEERHPKLLVLKKYLEACSAKCTRKLPSAKQGSSQVPDFRAQNATLKAQLFERSKTQFNELYSKVKLAVVSLDNAMNLLVPSLELGEQSSTEVSKPSASVTGANVPVTIRLQLQKTEVTKTADNNDLIKNATGLYQQIRTGYQPAVHSMIIQLRRSSCTQDLCAKAEQLLSEMTSVVNKFSEVEFVSDSEFESDSDLEDVPST
ncbi:hypothetical protein TTRE_0000219601 [Trichuris trichiura]|uniref:Uncharacterized protein n=1 Tax=Trichuris trichiura TaxID=36087 RepID=A0A077Z0G5_TRITR|nr:hypothetical protein TTRE_0000219601 [Trichuris trichiura]